ncbi:cytochrome P450 [Alphaproteobacteria bacterium GH1-50]|uniref:Cytochrome P450 n=1 Tax=Kangsaoukella pontilimi TaxID=2691042 RepID=A0A7C9MCM4_9RHOB|nr:cytochrome P450 [Kangsaoukella pontilimi]MXQ07691.1 cytochrome P450 [Kangsaoukella pontilimi]
MEPVRQSPTEPGFVQNPYPFYARLRAMGDFVYWDEYGMPMATTHEAVMAVLKHRDMGREVPPGQQKPVRPELRPFYDVEAHSMLEREPPDHTRLRGLVLRAFTKRRILHLAPEISQTADHLLSKAPSGPFDLLDVFARQLPVIVIARLLGVPESLAPELLEWSNRMVAMYQARRTPEIEADAACAAAEFAEFVRSYVEVRRRQPADDLISHLIAAEEGGEKLTTDELITTCILLLNAGHEATVHSLGNAVVQLWNFAGRDEALAPEAIEGTVEECLRFDPPLHMFTRHVYKPVEILGQRFDPGDEVGCLLASACRDDAVWPDGDVFDPFRPIRANASFGGGIHFCVGAPLARLEMQIALPILFARFRNLELIEPPRVANLYHFRGREKLMVTT